MKTIITEYNPTALDEINEHLKFSDSENEPIKKEIKFECFSDVNYQLVTVLKAIEFIGNYGTETELSICSGLAGIAQNLLPVHELNFLDSLLIKKGNNNPFVPIENIKNK
ncbi:hypothetical protein [Flavobacterium columnare]|uniref:hypothetical protein n=1 Tax=Flavobacterium columnare TaxID=996 RepID=UPI000D198413|nr:hypothetical protein [Flavobacterium columnare]PTD14373.1 hypothetical protein C6N29_07950 [Flavobacterium columnare]